MKEKLTIVFIDQKCLTESFSKYTNKNVTWLEVIGEYENKSENLKYIYNNIPNIIICNSIFPIFTDFINSKEISKIKEKSKIFVLSGNNDLSIKKASFDFGIKDYFYKPISFSKVISNIKESLN